MKKLLSSVLLACATTSVLAADWYAPQVEADVLSIHDYPGVGLHIRIDPQTVVLNENDSPIVIYGSDSYDEASNCVGNILQIAGVIGHVPEPEADASELELLKYKAAVATLTSAIALDKKVGLSRFATAGAPCEILDVTLLK